MFPNRNISQAFAWIIGHHLNYHQQHHLHHHHYYQRYRCYDLSFGLDLNPYHSSSYETSCQSNLDLKCENSENITMKLAIDQIDQNHQHRSDGIVEKNLKLQNLCCVSGERGESNLYRTEVTDSCSSFSSSLSSILDVFERNQMLSFTSNYFHQLKSKLSNRIDTTRNQLIDLILYGLLMNLLHLIIHPFTMLTALIFLSYWPSLFGELVFDDRPAIIENQDLRPTTPWSQLWFNDYWGNALTSVSEDVFSRKK